MTLWVEIMSGLYWSSRGPRGNQERGMRGSQCGWSPEACPTALQWPCPTCWADFTSAHMGLTEHCPGPSFQQMALCLGCRGGKLVLKMAIRGHKMLFQYF